MTQLTLGPIAYHWSADARRDFYARIADEAPVDEVYLGEVICSKRAPFQEADLPAMIERLEREPAEDPFALFDEWSSAADAEAYGDL